MSATDDTRIKHGSGNVFVDLGRPNAETHLLKAELVARIDQIIRERRLTQAHAAELLGISQPDVSRLLSGNFRDYSVERLLRLLTSLGRDVEITIRKPRTRRQGRLSIEAARVRKKKFFLKNILDSSTTSKKKPHISRSLFQWSKKQRPSYSSF